MSDFPILVARLTADQAGTLGCASCGYERKASKDEITQAEVWATCPRGHTLDWKYASADPCKACGKLGFWEKALDYCCSRVCMLQAEYAASLTNPNREDGPDE